MIDRIVKIWDERKEQLKADFESNKPNGYENIVERVVRLINPDREGGLPDPNRITTIDHGDYQGTMLFVIAEAGYQPCSYYAYLESYGSCSGCDTFQNIQEMSESYYSDKCSPKELEGYMSLALHVVQGLKEI